MKDQVQFENKYLLVEKVVIFIAYKHHLTKIYLKVIKKNYT